MAAIVWRAGLLAAAVALGVSGPRWIVPAVVLLVGILQYHVLVLSHEAQHFLLVRSRPANDLLGAWLLAYPFGQPFHSERRRHFAHHRLVGKPADPDYHRYSLDDKRPWRDLLVHYAKMASYGKVAEYVGSAARRAPGVDLHRARSAGELVLVAAVQASILSCFWAAGEAWAYFVLWLLPLWTIASALSEFREFCEHVSAPGAPHRLKTFRPPAWERFVLGPVDFVYHAEHHLYPSIPHHRLRELSALLGRDQAAGIETHRSYFDVVRLCRAPATR